ncbi:MAG: FGGY-family carbohydrate kinase [Thiogranum sp.]
MSLFIGIDVGTSACRACAIDERAAIVAEARINLPAVARNGARVEQDAGVWWQTLTETVDLLCKRLNPARVSRIAVDGTSATLLLCDKHGTPLTPGLMYNDARSISEAGLIREAAPADCAAQGASSSLAKLLHLRQTISDPAYLALHQTDWLTGMLSGHFAVSDENNALKLGYEPLQRRWPDWLARLDILPAHLPVVFPAGSRIGTLRGTLTSRWKLPDGVQVVAGTTDSTAGFIATGAGTTGTAVTALGSTLVIKVLSDHPVFAAHYGVYSHRLGDRWLVGGASNAGGATLLKFFNLCDIRRYTRLINPQQATGLDYYPLPAAGERFPRQDPALPPRLEPRPPSDAVFFQGILEGLAAIEQQGYHLLAELGAPYPQKVLTVGGGANNAAWMQIREQRLAVPVTRAAHQEAAFGAALLALGL